MKCLRPLILGVSFVVPVIACTQNVTSSPASDACSQLAERCPKCTIADLAATCNAAVNSHDPTSCQNGLDDHDIQTNCVSGTNGQDSGPPNNQDSGQPTNQDSGTAPDTSNPPDVAEQTCSGGDVCNAHCPAGGCTSCASQGVCMGTCEGRGCTLTCEGSANCNYDCPGGGCTLSCLGNASCVLICEGGGCTFDCATTGSCSTSCPGGGCSGH